MSRRCQWLSTFKKHVEENISSVFGIYGTTIAGSWLASQLNYTNSFFIDDDQQKIGKVFLEKPILSPGEVPTNAKLALAFVPQIAEKICRHTFEKRLLEQYIFPPAFEENITCL